MEARISDTREMHSSREERNFEGMVVAHAAVNGGMMANFGRGFARLLVDRGGQLHFFASRYPVFGWPPPVADLESIGGEFHGLPVCERLAPLRNAWALVLMTYRLRQLGVRVLHTRSSIMGAVGRLAGRLAGVPVIVHHQDDLHCRDTRLGPGMKSLVGWVEQLLSRLDDRTLFVSDAVMQEAIAIGFSRERCVLVGHDLSEVFQQAALADDVPHRGMLRRLHDLGVPDGFKIAGCVGRLAHIKGIDLLIDAIARLESRCPDWVFVVKGDGPLRESLNNRIAQSGLQRRILLLTEELPAEELPALYKCFDLFVLPTRREGFGMAFAEAMAMGVPVVGPRIAPVTEVVPNGCGVLVEPECVASLGAALERLLNHAEERERLGARGRQHALETWVGRRAAEKVLDVYRGLIAAKVTRNRATKVVP